MRIFHSPVWTEDNIAEKMRMVFVTISDFVGTRVENLVLPIDPRTQLYPVSHAFD